MPRRPRRLAITCGAKNLTHYGGVYLLHRFLSRIGFKDRSSTRSTVVTSQLPPKRWHDDVADPTLADAICDRLLHNAHRIVLQGPSRRREEKLDS